MHALLYTRAREIQCEMRFTGYWGIFLTALYTCTNTYTHSHLDHREPPLQSTNRNSLWRNFARMRNKNHPKKNREPITQPAAQILAVPLATTCAGTPKNAHATHCTSARKSTHKPKYIFSAFSTRMEKTRTRTPLFYSAPYESASGP